MKSKSGQGFVITRVYCFCIHDSYSMLQLKKEHPGYFRVEAKFSKSLNSKDVWVFLAATNSTHVLVHYFAQYMYARPDSNFGSEDGFSKATLNWLNLLLFFCVLIFIFLFMFSLPLVCLITGVYGYVVNNDIDKISSTQLMLVGVLCLVELIARVVWYLIGRLDTKESVFTFLETFDILPIPILALFIWGVVESMEVESPVFVSQIQIQLLLNVLGVVGWGVYLIFRLQKFVIHIFEV